MLLQVARFNFALAAFAALLACDSGRAATGSDGRARADPPSDSAVYRIVFEATWSSGTHPDDFPPGPHFSPLTGGVHNDRVSFWELGETSSPGMESMAETGATSLLFGEVRDEIPDDALSVVTGTGTGSPGSATIREVVVR